MEVEENATRPGVPTMRTANKLADLAFKLVVRFAYAAHPQGHPLRRICCSYGYRS